MTSSTMPMNNTAVMDNAAANDRYEAQTPAERHLRELLDELPRMQQVQSRLEAHHAACQLLSKHTGIEDLEGDIDELEAKDPQRSGVNPELYATLLKEKRAALERERARFAHDLDHSRFSSIGEVIRARLADPLAHSLETELNRYREDYAFTLAKCQGEQGGEGEKR